MFSDGSLMNGGLVPFLVVVVVPMVVIYITIVLSRQFDVNILPEGFTKQNKPDVI